MASLDMSLDDMIKNRKNSDKESRGNGKPRRGRGAGGSSRGGFKGGRSFGAPRRNPLGVNTRPSPHTIAKSFRRTKTLPWQNGMFEDGLKAAGLSGLEAGTKLSISNLDVGVSNEDIRELFAEIGELIRYAIHFDKNGRPSGSAEVVFARRSDAFQALKKYNNVQLDGKPMKIEIIGANSEIPVSARVNIGAVSGRKRTVVMASGPVRSRGVFAAPNRISVQRSRGGSGVGRGGSGGGRGGSGGRGGGGRGRVGGRWKKKTVEKSADDLDKELESYHASFHGQAMET